MAFSWRNLAGPDPNPMTVNECLAIQGLCRELDSEAVIVQIGAERGTSTLAIREVMPYAKFYSIDIGETVGETENLKRAALNPVVRLVGKSQGMDWDNGEIDFLFIDGDHRYEGVKGDIETWVPRVRDGGIVAFHDYIEPPIPQHIKGRVYYAVEEKRADIGKEIMRAERLLVFKK